MIPMLIYKNLHLIGVFMLFIAVGGLIVHQIGVGIREHPWRRTMVITHGIGMVLVLVGGFGMLARLGIFWPWPGWVVGKIVIWLIFGGLIAVLGRSPTLAKPLWWIAIVLGTLAAYLALNKPF
jgi:hypothetical protein